MDTTQTKLFIGGLSFSTTSESLAAAFADCGPMLEVGVHCDKRGHDENVDTHNRVYTHTHSAHTSYAHTDTLALFKIRAHAPGDSHKNTSIFVAHTCPPIHIDVRHSHTLTTGRRHLRARERAVQGLWLRDLCAPPLRAGGPGPPWPRTRH